MKEYKFPTSLIVAKILNKEHFDQYDTDGKNFLETVYDWLIENEIDPMEIRESGIYGNCGDFTYDGDVVKWIEKHAWEMNCYMGKSDSWREQSELMYADARTYGNDIVKLVIWVFECAVEEIVNLIELTLEEND